MRILGLPNGVNGSGYYRVYLPLTRLAKYGGHEVSLPPPARADRGSVEGFWVADQDAAVGHSIGHDAGVRLWESWKGDAALVYDIDDDLMAVQARWHPGLAAQPAMNTRGWRDRIVQMSDLVTVSTPVLAERMSARNPNVRVLPNCVNPRLLEIERPRRERLTVGWHGSGTHVGDIRYWAKPLRRFFQRHPEVDVHIAGYDYRPLIGRPDARFSPWRVNVWDHYRQLDFDIGLAPLAPNSFNEAKSYIKALEYAALGIPVIASDCPSYRGFVIDGVTGFLVRYEHEWEKRLRELACDEQMREEMGVAAKAHAAAYTADRHWREWEEAYGSVT